MSNEPAHDASNTSFCMIPDPNARRRLGVVVHQFGRVCIRGITHER